MHARNYKIDGRSGNEFATRKGISQFFIHNNEEHSQWIAIKATKLSMLPQIQTIFVDTRLFYCFFFLFVGLFILCSSILLFNALFAYIFSHSLFFSVHVVYRLFIGVCATEAGWDYILPLRAQNRTGQQLC